MKTKAVCAKSRFLMRGRYGAFIIPLLIYAIIVLIVNLIPGMVFSGTSSPALMTGSLLMSYMLTVLVNMIGTGISYTGLKCARGEAFLSTSIFYAFRTGTDAFLKLQLLFTAVSFAISIPSLFLSSLTQMLNIGAMGYYALNLAWGLLSRFISTLILMRFIFALYIVMDDPGIRAGDALKKSLALTKGKTFGIFTLICSFAGLYLLSIISLCLGFFFTKPYMETAKAVMYDSFKGNY